MGLMERKIQIMVRMYGGGQERGPTVSLQPCVKHGGVSVVVRPAVQPVLFVTVEKYRQSLIHPAVTSGNI